MEIANEGLIDGILSLKNKLIDSITKITNWISIVEKNKDYFKEAKLDPQQNKDLLQVLRISQPRTDINFKPIAKYYRFMNKKKDGTNQSHSLSVRTGGDYHSTSLLHEVERSTIDIDESLKAAKRSPEYKRIQSAKYPNKTRELIPLGLILADLKKSNQQLSYFRSELQKMGNTLSSLRENPEGVSNITKRMEVFFHKVIEYYTFRIKILEIYLKRAKTTLDKSTYSKNKEVTETNENRTKSSTSRHGIAITVNLKTPDQISKIKELYKNCKEAKTYDEYKPYYDQLTTMLNCHGKNIEKLIITGLSVQLVLAGDSDPVEVPLSGKTLYHNSSNLNLTELEGRWINMGGVLFPEPRIYFHVNFSTDRYGAKISDDSAVYVPVQKPKVAYRDPEMGRTAVYVITKKPIKIRKVNFNEIKDNKLKKIDLEINKSSTDK